jgi:hypothetical protein
MSVAIEKMRRHTSREEMEGNVTSGGLGVNSQTMREEDKPLFNGLIFQNVSLHLIEMLIVHHHCNFIIF